MTYTLITGASAGLGKAFAIQCARMGMNLVLIALPGSQASSLAQHIMEEYPVDVRAFELDLTDTAQMQYHLPEILSAFPVSFLINNAGIGGTAALADTPLENIDRIIQLNVRGTALLTRLMIPHLLQHERSYILNISSMASFTPIAYKTVYPASKAFITSFSLGIREEYAGTGLSVSVACPGPILTNSGTARRIIGQGLKARMGLLPTHEIARIALRLTLAGQPVIIPGLANRISHFLMQLMPGSMRLRLISREVKKEMQFSV
ncbi:SDR family NAD(P)-dependent oxidoreductase [Chitinophaga deserti]|uniref:SDR family NAD(P)-dependent oxidoreductase n=1 Tax=Chitinophaga deserti TaxID=2164099 RepID=UPI000D6AB93D|nr:SDR family NAD(P)-dependent oxidoreductase [Chitinophaga deserti]